MHAEARSDVARGLQAASVSLRVDDDDVNGGGGDDDDVHSDSGHGYRDVDADYCVLPFPLLIM